MSLSMYIAYIGLMNLKLNFGLGMAAGVALCLLTVSLMSSTNAVSAKNDALSGEFISTEAASEIINAYTKDWVQANNLPENTTIGGYIGRSNLAYVAGNHSDEEYVKFRFYFTKGENNAPQIGLVFYPTEDASAVLRTGSGSFCPTVCTQPN